MEIKICKTCKKEFSRRRSSIKQWQERKYCSITCANKTNKNKIHGFSRTPIYTAYKGMMARCYNKSCPEYKWYGARGIIVSKNWHDIKQFINDMLSSHNKNLQLDRIDNSKGYSKKNCHWVTSKENNSNKRSNRILKIDGVKNTMSEWARIKGMKVGLLWYRLEKGMDPKEALSKPVKKFKYEKKD